MSAPNVMADGKDRASVAAIAEEVATAYGVVEANGRGAVYLGSSRIGRGEKQYEASKELAREVGTLLGCTTWSGIGPGLMDAVTMGGLTANGRASGKCGIDDDDDEEKEFVRIDRFGFSLCVRVILFLLRKRRVSVAFLRSFAVGMYADIFSAFYRYLNLSRGERRTNRESRATENPETSVFERGTVRDVFVF